MKLLIYWLQKAIQARKYNTKCKRKKRKKKKRLCTNTTDYQLRHEWLKKQMTKHLSDRSQMNP